MPELKEEVLQPYLESLYGCPVRITNLVPLPEKETPEPLRACRHSAAVKIDYRVLGKEKSAVLKTVSPASFGDENMEDRARILIRSDRAFDQLPRHVRLLDLGAIDRNGSFVSLDEAPELFLVVEHVSGRDYSQDLNRMRETTRLSELDRARADALVDYLAQIHSLRGPRADLYVRRVRELVGHGDGIMGLTDRYPAGQEFFTFQQLEKIEHLVVGWRWRLKERTHRLRQVHGAFHPWNILFRGGNDFTVLDRSRGEWGEPADDVTCLSLHYLFCSLLSTGRLEDPFETLFHHFWERYLEMTQDREILEVAAPFFAFRGLIMASPVWYPNLEERIRRKLLHFIVNVLESQSFDPGRIHEYCR